MGTCCPWGRPGASSPPPPPPKSAEIQATDGTRTLELWTIAKTFAPAFRGNRGGLTSPSLSLSALLSLLSRSLVTAAGGGAPLREPRLPWIKGESRDDRSLTGAKYF